MMFDYDVNVRETFLIFETWSRNVTDLETCTATLDINDQDQLKVFAKYQRYVLKSFQIVRKLSKDKRKPFLEREGQRRLAKRWQIYFIMEEGVQVANGCPPSRSW